MMFLYCPAYLDDERTVKCGLLAEVRCRFTMRSTDGPLPEQGETGLSAAAVSQPGSARGSGSGT